MSAEAGTPFVVADRALAVPHREDDQPCGCDECMAYGAEDEGFDWYRVAPARRLVLRVLDSGDDRLSPVAVAFREHEEATSAEAGTLDEAWAAAEAALPEGWVVGQLARTAPAYPEQWFAYAYRSRGLHLETDFATGPTPAAALLALANALRAVPA